MRKQCWASRSIVALEDTFQALIRLRAQSKFGASDTHTHEQLLRGPQRASAASALRMWSSRTGRRTMGPNEESSNSRAILELGTTVAKKRAKSSLATEMLWVTPSPRPMVAYRRCQGRCNLQSAWCWRRSRSLGVAVVHWAVLLGPSSGLQRRRAFERQARTKAKHLWAKGSASTGTWVLYEYRCCR